MSLESRGKNSICLQFLKLLTGEALYGSKLNPILEVHNDAKIEFQRVFHVRGMPENKSLIEMYQRKLYLLCSESGANTHPRPKPERNECIWMPFLLLLAFRIKSLRLEFFWFREVFGILGWHIYRHPNPCTLKFGGKV